MFKCIFSLLIFIGSLTPLCGQGQRVLDSLREELASARSDSMRFEVLNSLARYTPEPSAKLKLAEQAKVLAESLGYGRGVGQSYMKMAQAQRKLGDLSQAISSILNALTVYEKAGYQRGVAVAYNTLGTIYASQGDYPKSIENLNQALTISQRLMDTTNTLDLKKLAGNYNNIGEVYRLSEQYDSALHHFSTAFQLYAQLDHSPGKAYALGNIGLVYASKGRSDEAEQKLIEASNILDSLGDRYPIAVYNTFMADIYKERGEMNKALAYATKSYDIALQESLKAELRDASLKMSEMYETLGDFRLAHFYQSQYIAYRDSINNEETIRKIADLRTAYEVSKKQIEVDLLNQEAATQRFIAISLAIILTLVIALSYVLYKGYTLKIKSHRMLAAQKSAIKTQRDELNVLNKTKDRFFSIISHDLRGPVGSFQGVSELIRILVDNDETEELLRVSDELDRSTRQLTALLDNLLYWALSQQGKFPYQPEKMHLAEACSTTFNVLENMATSKKIKLEKDVDDLLFLWVDRNSTLTIFRNLLNNALKFTAPGGTVTFVATLDGECAKVEIIDRGIGIPKDKLTTLFGFEGKRSRWGTAGEKGVGLGLTLTYEFVQMNNGNIEVRSEENQGTTFTIKLPLYRNQDK